MLHWVHTIDPEIFIRKTWRTYVHVNRFAIPEPTTLCVIGLSFSEDHEFEAGQVISEFTMGQSDWQISSEKGNATRHHAAAFLEGKIFLTGGFISERSNHQKDIPTNLVSAYDPKTGLWAKAQNMLECRARHGAVAYEKKLYVACGINQFKQ